MTILLDGIWMAWSGIQGQADIREDFSAICWVHRWRWQSFGGEGGVRVE